MHKSILFSSFFSMILSVFFISNLYGSADIKETLTDSAYQQLALSKKEYENIGRLEAEVNICGIRKRIFSASAVYLGGNTIVTAAHCIWPWCTNEGQLSYKLFFIASLNDSLQDISEFPIEEVKIREGYTSHQVGKEEDIALLRLQAPISFLSGLRPIYVPDLATVSGQSATVIGFGASGDATNYLSVHDNKKRACKLLIDSICSIGVDSDQNPSYKEICWLSNLGGRYNYNDSSKTLEILERDLLPYEGGARAGMSGGALLDSDNNFIGIYTFGITKNRFKHRLIYSIFKYTSALGISSPYLIPEKGDKNGFLSLGIHQKWIEQTRQAWDKKDL